MVAAFGLSILVAQIYGRRKVLSLRSAIYSRVSLTRYGVCEPAHFICIFISLDIEHIAGMDWGQPHGKVPTTPIIFHSVKLPVIFSSE